MSVALDHVLGSEHIAGPARERVYRRAVKRCNCGPGAREDLARFAERLGVREAVARRAWREECRDA